MRAGVTVALVLILLAMMSVAALVSAQNAMQWNVLADGSVLVTEIVDDAREVTGVSYGVWDGDRTLLTEKEER